MKRYTRKKLPNIEQMPMDESLFYSVHCNKSDFMRAALINSILMVPFSYILAIFVITFGCMHAVQSGDMLKLVLYIGAVAIFLGREIAAINKLYGIYVKGFGHSLDNQGINTIYSVPEDGGCRHIAAMPWEKVGNILVCGNFMIVNIERKSRKAEAFPMPIFWSEDIESVSRQALYLWKRALDTKPEEREYIYAENEMHEVMGYVEERFGEIQGIRPVTLSNINLGIAVIPPAEERDYYTLCTLGAGAYRMPVDRDLHLNDGVAKHAEYMMILPKEWKMGKESFEDNQYSWPFDLVAKVATAPLRLDTINMHGKVYSNVGDSPQICHTAHQWYLCLLRATTQSATA